MIKGQTMRMLIIDWANHTCKVSEWVNEWRERKWEKTTKKGNQPIWRMMCRENNEYSKSSKEVQTFYKPVQRTITKFFEKLMKMGASDFVSLE